MIGDRQRGGRRTSGSKQMTKLSGQYSVAGNRPGSKMYPVSPLGVKGGWRANRPRGRMGTVGRLPPKWG